MNTVTVPSSEIDLFSDETLLDPYPRYRELRESGPVVYLERHEVWAVPRFEDVRNVLRDWEGFTSEESLALNGPTNGALKGTLIGSSPPLHTKLRRVLSARLSPGAVSALSEEICRQADELVATLVARGSFDAAQDLAAVFPIAVVADLIGLPSEGREKLYSWGNAMFDSFGPENERTFQALPLVGEMFEYIATTATPDRLAPGSMGMAVYEAAERGEVEPESCIGLMGAYLAPGMDTTINAIGSVVHALAVNPDQWRSLKDDPDLIRGTVNEVLRYDSPVQVFGRRATGEKEVAGRHVSAGDQLVVIYGSANRDERRWERPDLFDVTRNPIDHLGFGHGVHRCAGAALARLELEAVLTALVRRVELIEMAGTPVRRINNTVRGFRRLPVVVG